MPRAAMPDAAALPAEASRRLECAALCLPRITHPPFPVETATSPKFLTRRERDLQARIRALRPYVAALPASGATAVEIAAALWSRTDARSCSQVASVLSVARRHGFVRRTYTKGTIAVFERTAAGDALIAEPTP
jgi:hypothetical protein